MKRCPKCNSSQPDGSYFCLSCGAFMGQDKIDDSDIYSPYEQRFRELVAKIRELPHSRIVWNDLADQLSREVERLSVLLDQPEFAEYRKRNTLPDDMRSFLDSCYKPDFQIAFVGTIKTGKSTLINALLGHEYASMDVTPETAALTKFRASAQDYVRVTFYSKEEWERLWASRTSGADAFMQEYNDLKADKVREKYVGAKRLHLELASDKVKDELTKWSSSKHPEHYFVKEIEVGISSLPADFPPEVVFVDTPGLSDPVQYRSDITREYIRRANAVFVCVNSNAIYREELATISSVFSFSAHDKSKVFVIATQYDKLNAPKENWAKQKSYLESRLVGPGFYDRREEARNNVLVTSGYIYNVCNGWAQASQIDKMNVMFFGMKLQLLQTATPSPDDLKAVIDATGVRELLSLIRERLVKHYKDIVQSDIIIRYKSLLRDLKRMTEERSAQEREIIESADMSLDALNKKVAEQLKAKREIEQAKADLSVIMEKVSQQTNERMNAIHDVVSKQTSFK